MVKTEKRRYLPVDTAKYLRRLKFVHCNPVAVENNSKEKPEVATNLVNRWLEANIALWWTELSGGKGGKTG